MTVRVLTTVIVAFASLHAAVPLHAQRRDAEPRRPALAASADTNDAAAYYALGRSRLRAQPADAAIAFYWAMRLDPTKGEPYYARRTALLMTDARRLVGYLDGEARTLNRPEVKAADSLYRVGLGMSPLMFREFDREMIQAWLIEWGDFGRARAAGVSERELLFELENLLIRAGPYARGWMAYAERRLPEAAEYWEQAVRRARRKAPVLFERGEVFYLMGQSENAATEMQSALVEMRKADNDAVVYRSKAYYELALGVVYEAADRHDDAMAAFGRALQEDLSYYPAHRRMAQLALTRNDTMAAVASLALGAAMDDADAALRHDYATLLLRTGQHEDAAEQARRLIAAEPYFAGGYIVLGRALDALGNTAGALEAYDAFLARARRADPERRAIDARVRRLRAGDGA